MIGLPEFKTWDKIYRLHRNWIATEKIDGANGCVIVTDAGDVFAQSRNRVITTEADSFGFARWVKDNATELTKLGPGYHFGEYYGGKIQRGYGLKEKRFALFNTARWSDPESRPACCECVPVLASGLRVNDVADMAMALLRTQGSFAVPGFDRPEGIVLFHEPSQNLYKVTLEKDEKPKGSKEEQL